MKIAFGIADITPDQPYKLAGFIQQKEPVTVIHDPLEARILGLQDEKTCFYSISVDSLGFPASIQKTIEEKLGGNVHVIISATHTHFAPDAKIPAYAEYVTDKILKAIQDLNWQKKDLYYSISEEKWPIAGTSRITNHEADVRLYCMDFWNEQAQLARLICYNCHPTVHSYAFEQVSAEYPGYVLKKLREKNPGIFYSFYQGAAGDVSTRFTRAGQNDEAMERLGDLLVEEIQKQSAITKYPLDHLAFQKQEIEIQRDFSALTDLEIPTGISERERSEIETGRKVRERLLQNKEKLQKIIVVSAVSLSDLKLVFVPNELFSAYIRALASERSVLICYSNGYHGYLPGLNFHTLTYELFYDTSSRATKEELLRTIHNLSQ